MTSFLRPQHTEAPTSFDDEVRTSAQYQARILREFGYRTEASHIDRYVDGTVPHEESAA